MTLKYGPAWQKRAFLRAAKAWYQEVNDVEVIFSNALEPLSKVSGTSLEVP